MKHGSNLRLAVSAPWCVELDQDVLGLVKNNVVVVLGDDNSDWAIVLFWDRLALDAGVNLARNKIINKLANLLVGELVLGEGKLLVLLGVLDGESGPLADLEVEVTSVLTESLGVDGSEVDLALVLLCNLLEVLGDGLALLWGLSEDVSERKTRLGVR